MRASQACSSSEDWSQQYSMERCCWDNIYKQCEWRIEYNRLGGFIIVKGVLFINIYEIWENAKYMLSWDYICYDSLD